jgi:N-acetylmuramoyl-L-alanine amidase
LEQGGSVVMMTRIEDEALGDKKASDMQGRRDLSALSKADIFISIHQNSYPSNNVRGAQVFYYSRSEEGKRLAEAIQYEIKDFVDTSNRREVKPNDEYYILKHTSIPAVIIECGFLTSADERNALINDEYQEKMAWAIYMGIIRFFGELL